VFAWRNIYYINIIQIQVYLYLISLTDIYCLFNILEPEFYIQILAHPVFKMWIIQEPKKVALQNKRHFKEKKTEIMQHV